MRGNRGWVELHVIPATGPHIAGIAQLIVYLITRILFDLEFIKGQSHEPCLGAERVQVNDDDNQIHTVGGAFTVTDNLLIIDRMEVERPVALKRYIVAAHAVDRRDEAAQ